MKAEGQLLMTFVTGGFSGSALDGADGLCDEVFGGLRARRDSAPAQRRDPLRSAFPQFGGGLPQCGGARIRTWEG
ncbi:hypothetical protein GCM10010228_43640 [Streptomyces massasporeus]|nr:hypothetical protein GCM10010228_43640 [Streptomyces massasporeus]